MDVYEYIKKKNNKKNNKLSDKFSKVLTKILITIIFVFVSIIYVKKSDDNLKLYKKNVFETTISFNQANKFLSKFLGTKKRIPLIKDAYVFNEANKTQEKFLNGAKITYTSITPIKALESGVVVFIGEKDNLGKTIIVQGTDEYDIWYSNVSDFTLNMYDYIEKDSIIGNSNEVIITISKNGNFIDYEEYQNKA